jgi:hypothetical protein
MSACTEPLLVQALASLSASINNPSGVWADFNRDHYHWTVIKKWAEGGLLCPSLVPAEPAKANYGG